MNNKFSVSITGVSEELDINLVAEKFASLFKIEETTALNVIFRKQTIRHEVDQNVAYKYKEALESIGVMCRIDKFEHLEEKTQDLFQKIKEKEIEDKVSTNNDEVRSNAQTASSCPYCAEEIKPNATICPHCKQAIFSKKPLNNAVLSLIAFIIVFFVIYHAIGSFVNHEADKEYNRIMDKVERDMKRFSP